MSYFFSHKQCEYFSISKSSASGYCLAIAWFYVNFSLSLLVKVLLIKKACIFFKNYALKCLTVKKLIIPVWYDAESLPQNFRFGKSENQFMNQIIQSRKLISFEINLGNLLKLNQCEKKYLQFHNEQVYLFNFVDSTESC